MKLSDAFPSNYLKCSDLNGRSSTVTIDSVAMETFGQGRDAEQKLIIHFRNLGPHVSGGHHD